MAEIPTSISNYGQIPSGDENLRVFVIISKSTFSLIYFSKENPIAFQIYKKTKEILEAIIKSIPEISQQVSIIFDNRFFSVFPTGVINELNKNQISLELFNAKNHDSILSKNLDNFDFLFLSETDDINLINKYLTKKTILHYSQIILQNNLALKSEKEEVNFEIRDGYFYAVLLKNNNLKLINSYEYVDKNEFGFYSLGTIKNLGFDAENLNLLLSGSMQNDSPLQQLLSRYIANIQFPKLNLPNEGFIQFAQIINFNKL